MVSVDDQQWHLNRIGVPEAWEITSGNPAITVAVLDTGIDHDNQDLFAKVIGEINLTNSSTSDDLNGHGTHMAGAIAQVAPECSLLIVKVLDDDGKCQASQVAEAIVQAVDYGANVISMSFEGSSSSSTLKNAVDYASNHGVVVVAAAGNHGSSAPTYPACYSNCIAVAASDESDSLASFSNHGDWVNVAAPGVQIYSTGLDNQYEARGGTSSAAALVSGEAALVFSVLADAKGNSITSDEVRQAIENTCSPINADGVGKGLINAYAAVGAVASLDSVSS